jgi:hypothetical protein
MHFDWVFLARFCVILEAKVIMASSSSGNAKRKATTVQLEDGSVMEIMPIGAGSEVGRSCIIVKFKGKQVMVSSVFYSRFVRCSPALLVMSSCGFHSLGLCAA